MAIESDRADIISGVRAGQTIGGPIAMFIENRNWVNWQRTMYTGPEPAPHATGEAAALRRGHGRKRTVRIPSPPR